MSYQKPDAQHAATADTATKATTATTANTANALCPTCSISGSQVNSPVAQATYAADAGAAGYASSAGSAQTAVTSTYSTYCSGYGADCVQHATVQGGQVSGNIAGNASYASSAGYAATANTANTATKCTGGSESQCDPYFATATVSGNYYFQLAYAKTGSSFACSGSSPPDPVDGDPSGNYSTEAAAEGEPTKSDKLNGQTLSIAQSGCYRKTAYGYDIYTLQSRKLVIVQ